MSPNPTDPIVDNPLLETGGLPRFDRIEAAHIVPAVKHLVEQAEQELATIEESIAPTWEGCFAPLERLDIPFEYGWEPVSHLFGVMSSPELREAYEEVLNDVVQLGLRCSQSRPIYEACLTMRDGDEWDSMNSAKKRIIEKRIQSAELAGIGLGGEERDRFNEIVQELSQLSTQFSNNVLDATKAFSLELTDPDDVEGMPESALTLAAQSYNSAKADADDDAGTETAKKVTPDSGPWRFTLDAPSFGPFMEHCRRRDLREKMYRAYLSRASSGELDNKPLIDKVLKLRQEKAQLLGFDNYCELSLASKMAPDVSSVEKMFETLRAASWDAAVKDLDELRQLAANDVDELRHWDVAFYSERLRERKFDYTDEQLRPWFPIQKVLDGMFALVERLFGIRVQKADHAPVWHEDVLYYEIRNEADSVIAGFYLDPYARPENKRPGAWMDSCLSRRVVDGQVQNPVAHLVCNSTPPVGDRPSLMTFREVETLFHEFGHGLQHMLTTIDEADAAGISNVEWDAVELPSQFMENWCYHRPTVDSISGHFETGEPLPDDLFQKLTAARTYRAGSQMLRQLRFGMTDMELHKQAAEAEQRSAFDIERSVCEKTSVLPPLPEDRFLCSFSHIFAGGYAAGYYSYKWAEVLSADAFSAFEEAGLADEAASAETGRRFRDTVLSQGGSQHPMDLFREFRGREPDPTALLRHNGLA